MLAKELYLRIEKDFNLSECTDEWDISNREYLTQNFISRGMGLMMDNTDIIEHVYTAVFPSAGVINSILSGASRSSLLFVHHPMDWDITKPKPFLGVSKSLLRGLKDGKVSLYNLHTALDKNGQYSTSVNLARACGIDKTCDFYEYSGGHLGVIGETECGTADDMKIKLERVLGHPVVLYGYGDVEISSGKVALIAGGGNIKEIYGMLRHRGINTYITGITSSKTGYEPAIRAHENAMENRINIIGGTHYSTEKYACIKMAEYFLALGLPCEFIPDRPCMEDM